MATKSRTRAAKASTPRFSVQRPALETSPPPFPVVGIGASAGGFEAFCQLLEALPSSAKMAIVFVQHLAPHHGSSLPALLAHHTKLNVVEVTEGVPLQPNHVYVVPPNAQMEVVDGHLHLAPRPVDRSQYTPIDFFFRSMARTLQNRAIGVVLSGTASDGAEGLRDIKTMGGITLAQDPKTAKYDGMPRAAIATRMVDLVLPPRQLASKLMQIAKHPLLAPAAAPPPPEPEPTVTEGQLEKAFQLLLAVTGVNFAHYKSPTIMRRLFRRMALLRITGVNDYLAHLAQTPDEVINLHNELLIHVTRFFREPHAFDFLKKEVLPEIIANAGPITPIRAWVAGCSTGEEAYSLAIALLESVGASATEAPIQVFGTDVSEAAIDFARRGVYPVTIAENVSPERLHTFFNEAGGGYRVTKLLRDLCVFARQDLTRDPPFSRLDLICCRNVLIYMDSTLQKKLLSVFHYALKPAGVLLLGHAESIGYSELFSVMDKKHRIHRKKPHVPPGPVDLPVPSVPARIDSPARTLADTRGGARVFVTEANRIVLDRYAPPSVLVDQNFHVVQFNGQTGNYLEPSPGEPSFNVMKLAREGLLHGLRTALESAKKTRRAARKSGLRVRNGSTWHDVDLEVIPMAQLNQTHYLVLFEAPSDPKAKRDSRPRRPRGRTSDGQSHRAVRLEEELAATREYLQSTIQEIEAANEELQSANEEILSSNEELQSTNEELDTAKEELESTNEELNTVNDELHGRNEELTRVNADLLNLLSSVQIAIVIVSTNLRVRHFTPMAEQLLNLIPADIGRPITHIKPNILLSDLPALITETIDSVKAIDREVQDDKGSWYSLRIRPYKSAENRIEGAVVALVDIDGAKRYAQHLKNDTPA